MADFVTRGYPLVTWGGDRRRSLAEPVKSLPSLDVSAWNLFVPLAIATACGQAPGAADEGADTGSATEETSSPDSGDSSDDSSDESSDESSSYCQSDADCSSPFPACQDEGHCTYCNDYGRDLCELGTICVNQMACIPAPLRPMCEAAPDPSLAPDSLTQVPVVGLLRLAHVNDDAILDVVALRGAEATLLSGPLDGIESVLAQAPGASLSDIVVGELTGSPGPDLVLTAPEGTWVFEGQGGGVFTQAWNDEAIPGHQLQGGDFDGDGVFDIALLDEPGGYIYVASVDGPLPLDFSAKLPFPTGRDSRIVAADFMGTASTDIATTEHCEYECEVYYWRSLSHEGAFVTNPIPVVGTGIVALTAIQLDADPRPELAGMRVEDGHVRLQSFDAPGVQGPEIATLWTVEAEVLDVYVPTSLAAGDIDGNGFEDLVMAAGTGFVVQFRDGPAHDSGCTVSYPLAHAADHLAVGDVDGDGQAEVLVSDGETTTSVLGLVP